MRRYPTSRWTISARGGWWNPSGLTLWLPIFAVGTATALNVIESYNFESVGCERLIASPDSYPLSELAAVRHKLEHSSAWKSALHCSLSKRLNFGALCVGLRGGGETPSRATKSTPKFERSAKKRRHKPAFHHADKGSEEEAGSTLHSDRTFRWIMVPFS
jgi:hypothetical protein